MSLINKLYLPELVEKSSGWSFDWRVFNNNYLLVAKENIYHLLELNGFKHIDEYYELIYSKNKYLILSKENEKLITKHNRFINIEQITLINMYVRTINNEIDNHHMINNTHVYNMSGHMNIIYPLVDFLVKLCRFDESIKDLVRYKIIASICRQRISSTYNPINAHVDLVNYTYCETYIPYNGTEYMEILYAARRKNNIGVILS